MTEQEQALIDAYYENIGEWTTLSENEKEWVCELKIDRDLATAELRDMAANRTWAANNGFALLMSNLNQNVDNAVYAAKCDIAGDFMQTYYHMKWGIDTIAKQLRHLPGWTM